MRDRSKNFELMGGRTWSVGIIAVLLMGGLVLTACRPGYLNAPRVSATRARVVVAKKTEVRIVPPRFRAERWPRYGGQPPMQELVDGIMSGLFRLNAQEVCSDDRSISDIGRKQGRVMELEDLVAASTGLMATTFQKTWNQVKNRYPETNPYLRLLEKRLNDLEPDARARAPQAILWLMTEATAQYYCQLVRPKPEGSWERAQAAGQIAFALAHWATSRELIYHSLFMFMKMPLAKVDSKAFYWSQQANATRMAYTSLGSVLKAPTGKRSAGFQPHNVKVRLGSSALPISCEPKVEITNILSPKLTKAGSSLPFGTQFMVNIKCKNTSGPAALPRSGPA